MDMEIFFPGRKKVTVKYGKHIIETDQPIEEGGEALAPEPFTLFIASIGACTGYYVLSFCQNRDIPTKDMKLILHIVRDKTTHMVSNIEIEILLPKDFPVQYEKAVVRSAEQCTVKKHLDHSPEISIKIKK